MSQLSASGNPIRILPKNIFKGLQYLKSITFIQCKIKILPKDVFQGLARLQWLDFRQNKISSLADFTFQRLPSITNVMLGENNIADISDHVFDSQSFSNTARVDLTYNELSSGALVKLKEQLGDRLQN